MPHEPAHPTPGGLMYAHSRLVWLRLNADGVLLAALSLIAGLDLLNPDLSDITTELGYVPPTFFLWTGCYLLAGSMMLAGFITRSIGTELLGRLLLILGFAIQTYADGNAYGWGHSEVITDYVVAAVLIAAQWWRAKTLLVKEPLHIIIGGRRHP